MQNLPIRPLLAGAPVPFRSMRKLVTLCCSILPMESRAKILRSIEDNSFQRMGSTETHSVKIRIIAATNKDLPQLIKERAFREDLFHRLNVITLQLRPLRERPEDIPRLVEIFLFRYFREMSKSTPELTPLQP